MHSQNDLNPKRFIIIVIIMIILFSILFVRIYDLQVVKYYDLYSRSIENIYRKIDILAPRGKMLDRYNRVILYNNSSYNLVVYPAEIHEYPETWNKLSQYFQLPISELKSTMKKNMIGYYFPTVLKENIDYQTLTYLYEHMLELQGIDLVAKPVRKIKEGANAAHIIGYINQIGKKDLKAKKNKKYKAGDIVGWKGLEKEYEDILRGQNGIKFMKINAIGQNIGEEYSKRIEPIPGNDLILTIDWDLQSYVESLIEDTSGAAIVINYLNGEILALASMPDFNPEMFSTNISDKDWRDIVYNPKYPLYNRAIQAEYPPGSVYKLVAVITSQEDSVVSPSNDTFNCPGYYRLGRRIFHCWKSSGHGSENMYEAIEHSCNVFFYKLMLKLDFDEWIKYSKILGFGQLTNIDLPDEKNGNVPDRKYMNKTYGRWGKGYLLNFVIGQGDVLVTPIQLAKYVSIIASNGLNIKPHLVKVIYYHEKNKLVTKKYSKDKIEGLSEQSLNVVKEGMRRVMQGEEGTARYSNIENLDLHGKTGTAQNPHGKDHAWFIGFSGKSSFPYAVVIFVENGEGGSKTAAPIAKKIYKYYWDLHNNEK